MDAATIQPRPHHRRNPSSRNIFKSLVGAKSRPASPELNRPPTDGNERTKNPLSERQSNVQSPPSSTSKSQHKTNTNNASKFASTKSKSKGLKKSKSSTNIGAMFGKMNRSSKDLSKQVPKDKENSTPPSSSSGPAGETTSWSQLETVKLPSRPGTSDSKSLHNINDEIARYTPKEYSASNQRNFNGTLEQPSLRPRLTGRPQSAYYPTSGGTMGTTSRTQSIDQTSEPDKGRSMDQTRRSEDKEIAGYNDASRKVSGSSTEQAPVKERLTIAKRGGRVLAAVAALQGKSKTEPVKEELALDPKAVDEAFETVLASRNIPEPMREKMRCLTMRVKADFVKQDQGSQAEHSPTELQHTDQRTSADNVTLDEKMYGDEDGKSTKRSRTRSRTFTFSKADKRGDASPSKKMRSQSKNRSTSTHRDKESSSSSKPFASLGRRHAAQAAPTDYITYLKSNQDPTQAEVGRLHKLRILLRNETVAWVDSFVSLGGMAEIVGLLHRIMAIEWREEHEDQLLHETLLCLKGLCTTERAMLELEKVADDLFPALVGQLFDDEKKGPAEYTTRTVIINVLFNFLSAATTAGPEEAESRARKVLTYLGEPPKPEEARPVDFVLEMHMSRPFKIWNREVSNVTKEVFWIFLHHLNVVSLPKVADLPTAADQADSASSDDRAKAVATTYIRRHFPGTRPPVPAAPYIGGVEWDATTYLAAHLDLMNGLIASIPGSEARNDLREQLQASGFEKVMGSTLRTCKEKFYSGVHDGLRAWVAAASEDGWDTKYVREGPTLEEQARSCSPKKSPKKKASEAPKLDLNLGIDEKKDGNGDDDGWLG